MNKYILTIAASLIGLAVFSQENQIWYFGWTGAGAEGISFNSGTPTPRNGEAAVTIYESITVQSTGDNLLFYSDGHDVYDKNHKIMPNGGELNWYARKCKRNSSTGRNIVSIPW